MQEELSKALPRLKDWWNIQNDRMDLDTNFIYKCNTFNEVIGNLKKLNMEQFRKSAILKYTLRRWYNFHTAMFVERIFKKHYRVTSAENSKDKEKDFYIDGISFDHKNLILPQKFKKIYNFTSEKEIIQWLYDNQSQEWRKHNKSRIFLWFTNIEDKVKFDKIEIIINNFLSNRIERIKLWDDLYSKILFIWTI